MTKRLASLLLVTSVGLASPAPAQDSVGWVLPRNQMAGIPSSAPTLFDCRKKACIYLVNISNHRVTQFRYATKLDKKGAPVWSGNAFPSNYVFYSKRYTFWYPPKEAECALSLKVVMDIDGKDHEESASFDICKNTTLLFYIRDPTQPQGTVTVDPIPPEPIPVTPPAKP